MNDLTLYRHSIYDHAETGEVAVSVPVSLPVDTAPEEAA